MDEPTTSITRCLQDETLPAAEKARRLLSLLYEELRAAARQRLSNERRDHTLSATALVHEAYLKLVGPRDIPWASRAHFYVAAAEAMRQILIDHARSKNRAKRGGLKGRVDLEVAATLSDDADARVGGGVGTGVGNNSVDFVTLDEALCRLKEKDPRAATVVNLRYFAGLSIADTAAALQMSEKTVKNDWAFARSWLQRELSR
ncbi:MAG: sigma-70 family RNA polymerase sigma factor [Phycisphaerae bacterium]